MILEFAGLPGSGKTTLSSALKTALLPRSVLSRQEAVTACIKQRDDGKVKNLLKKLPTRFWWPFMGTEYDLSEFIDLSSWHLELISFVSDALNRSTMEQELTASIWKTIARSFIELQLVTTHMRDSEVILMDEAFSQRCFTLFGYMEKPISEKWLFKYAELAPISNHIVWISTPPEICINRLRKRFKGKPCPYDLDSEELLESFFSGQMILKRLTDILQDKEKHVYQIDGDSDVAVSSEALKNAVQGVGGIYA